MVGPTGASGTWLENADSRVRLGRLTRRRNVRLPFTLPAVIASQGSR